MRSVSLRSAMCVFGLFSTFAASASTIGVFGTGVDGSGNALAAGSVDPHWTVAGGPNAFVGQGATVSEASTISMPGGWPFTAGGWIAPSVLAPVAQWIAPTPDLFSMSESADTEFDYSTTFSLTGLQLNTVELKGFFAADNQTLGLYLNGVLIPGTTQPGTPANFEFNTLSPFDVTSGFVGGVNTLSLHTLNANTGNPNPSGGILQVSGTGIAAIPEPGTLAVVASGLTLLGMVHKRRRRR
jgi:hypothetical protein